MTITQFLALLGLSAFWSLLFFLCARAAASASQQRDVVNVCMHIQTASMGALFASIVGLAAVGTYALIAL